MFLLFDPYLCVTGIHFEQEMAVASTVEWSELTFPHHDHHLKLTYLKFSPEMPNIPAE